MSNITVMFGAVLCLIPYSHDSVQGGYIPHLLFPKH
jgi:hypothetical protein